MGLLDPLNMNKEKVNQWYRPCGGPETQDMERQTLVPKRQDESHLYNIIDEEGPTGQGQLH